MTLTSLPGIGRAEITTVSPSCSATCGWSSNAMRLSADSGSPWLPVVTISSSSGAVVVDLGELDHRAVGHV